MSTRADAAAFPVTIAEGALQEGMTKRELAAFLIMGCLFACESAYRSDDAANLAVEGADALIRRLNVPPSPPASTGSSDA